MRSPHPTGTYVAVLADSGDLHIAVADMRAADELAVADLASVPGLLTGADALVVDANLSESVRWLLNAAAEAGVLSILDPVSVAKATAVAPVLDGTIPVHTVTPNVDELFRPRRCSRRARRGCRERRQPCSTSAG